MVAAVWEGGNFDLKRYILMAMEIFIVLFREMTARTDCWLYFQGGNTLRIENVGFSQWLVARTDHPVDIENGKVGRDKL
jgi:hypothetical protein